MAGARIVIVDDEIIIARELEARLVSLGYDVVGIAHSGPEAIALAEQTRPGLVLMDIILSGDMDGIEVAEEISRRMSLPVIYITAYTDRVTLQRASITGPYGYIVKPFSERELHANIEIALYEHQAEAKLREMEATRTRLIHDLEQSNRELEAFSYLASHDLRSPLRGIQSLVEILLEDHAADLPPKAQNYLNLMQTRANQMDRLIEDLLAFARLNRHPLKKQRVVTTDLVRETLSELDGEKEGRRQVEIKVGDLPVCQADPALLRQVFLNLLANALKYTRSKETTVIEVGCQGKTPEGEPVFFVKDNGIGFDSQYRDKIFNVFERLHSVDEYEGTGVGLAIVQRVIERHGGRVWAESKVDVGATFFFTLGNGTAKVEVAS